ncbi:hypothetical protein CA13_28930 [Planctomycetes bacterium CA13]|uniref:Uncharacterized protein n=1 Tax=Novipirellula herctigrandis TaxID=2527986 RepID=A0A5C5Z2M9_9BACT|nr:hypothetical protein CA13_28930 [Planctomycetes bacterium CA13]
MRSVDADDLFTILGIDKDDVCGFIRFGQSIDFVDLQTENVSSTGGPRDLLARADVSEELMLRARGDQLDLQFK